MVQPNHKARLLLPVPGQLVQVGEHPLGDVLYEVVVHVEGVDVGQTAHRLPGRLRQVVVAQVQVLQGGHKVVKGMRGDGVQLVVGQDQVAQVGQPLEVVVLEGGGEPGEGLRNTSGIFFGHHSIIA